MFRKGNASAPQKNKAPLKRGIFDDDEDDFDEKLEVARAKRRAVDLGDDSPVRAPASRYSPERSQNDGSGQPDAPDVAIDAEEDDPLEAFMAGISNDLREEAAAPRPATKPTRRHDYEEDDNIESYIKHMKEKGIDVGSGKGQNATHNSDADSDEEVYATARAIDAATANIDPDDLNASLYFTKKEIEPLPPVDHSTISYLEIEKDFYEEHPDISALTNAEVQKIRSELSMNVTGHAPAKPCISFAHFQFDDALLNAIRKQGFTQPSAIQQQAVPVALNGRDIIGIAKTGSGKTASFVWPMLVHIMDQQELEKGDGPIGLILAPTRELASQIHTEAKKFAKCYDIRVSVVYGGASKGEQFKELRSSSCEILVATPGRLIDLIKMKATNLKRVSFLVLDEADRMFDLGFEPQVRSICKNVRPDRQTLLFSATFPRKIESLTREILTSPIRISIGSVGVSNSDITQIFPILPDDSYKWNWLTSNLVKFTSEGSVIVFIGKKAGVDELAGNLREAGFGCEGLHGDMMQHDRDRVVREFKAGKGDVRVLVCTDVAARGLDIRSVRVVVNYDVARDIDSHVHRIGRTGRAGEKGTAYTLVTQKEDRFAGELVRNLEESGQNVPADLLALAMRNGRFRSFRE
ncbi:hypothetical protein HK097_011652, partial [Rhizophlyctis rosea]